MITNPANQAVKEFMEAHNLGVREAARILSLSPSLVSRVIRGERTVTPSLKVRFDRVFCRPESSFYFSDAIKVSIIIGDELDRAITAEPFPEPSAVAEVVGQEVSEA